MNKIINPLWAVVLSVSCFAAVRVGSGYSLIGLNEGAGEVVSKKLSTFSTAKQPPQFVVDLNGYGFGNDSLHWTWADLKKESVFVNLKLSAATLRYYYPSLIQYGQRLHTICTNGTAPLKYPYDPKSHFHYLWTPFSAVKQIFDSATEKEFIKSWRDEIDDHMYKNVCEIAWAKNLGVSYTLHVGKDGDVINSAMFLDTSHHKKTATEGGATGLIGDNKFPGNQLKIFFSGALSQIIADQLDTPEKFTNWLLGGASGVKPDFPAREALKQALISDGSQILNWSAKPVWGDEKNEVSLLKKVISSGDHFTQIRSVAAKSASKDTGTGMVIKIVRQIIDVCDFVVEQQGSPQIYLTDDGYTATADRSQSFIDRLYSCTFSWKNSVPNLYLSDTSNIFYDRLTAYDGRGPDWSLGKKFRNGVFASRDLDNIQEIINGTIAKSLVDLNEYVSWPHFQEMLQRALWIHKRINIKFGFEEDKEKPYWVSVKWWNT